MTEREVLQREIAAILDHPSVYMGGPSRQNMRNADRIVAHLERTGRIALAVGNRE